MADSDLPTLSDTGQVRSNSEMRNDLQADGEEGQSACDDLGIEVLPTVQFWKNKQMLWEYRGVSQLDQNMSEGALHCHVSLNASDCAVAQAVH